MKPNVSRLDRQMRVIFGLVLFSLFFLPGDLNWLGLLGFIPLVTALVRWCPLYTLLGINSCGIKKSPTGEAL